MSTQKNEENFAQKAEEKLEDIKQTYQEYKHNLVGYTQKNPIAALALAAAAGVLLGACWSALRPKK